MRTLPRLPWLQWPVGPFDEAQTSWGQSPLLHEVGCSSDGIDSQRARLAVSQGPAKAECPWGLDSWSHWLKTSSEQKKCLGRGSRDVAVGPRRVSCLTASLSPFSLLGNGLTTPALQNCWENSVESRGPPSLAWQLWGVARGLGRPGLHPWRQGLGAGTWSKRAGLLPNSPPQLQGGLKPPSMAEGRRFIGDRQAFKRKNTGNHLRTN